MWRSWLIVFALWAAIYLPSLGSLELKGEEGRRILPAVTMLKSGDYLIPRVGSEPYLRKPPLVNWLVAASFKIFGVRNEWTARLPSALMVLAVALAFLAIARPSLGAKGSLIAAVIWLTNFGMIEKGRLIEIEALYVSLFGLAIIGWLSWWQQRRSPWFTWTVPFVFLGLGLLAKGPLHLFFFYAIVLAVLWQNREWRELVRPAHFVGIILMLGIFAAWALPYLDAMDTSHVGQTWSRQFSGRLEGEDFELNHWLLNIPRGLAYFLPWLLFLPLAASVRFGSEREGRMTRGLGWGIAVPFVVINLIPGALPRYTMPLLVPAAWFLAAILTTEQLTWPARLGGRSFSVRSRQKWIIALALVAAGALCLYAVAVVPQLEKRAKVKTIAAQIDALIPAGETLYAVDPDYQPYLFYVRTPLEYKSKLIDLPATTHYFLVQPKKEKAAAEISRWTPRRPQRILRIKDYRRRRTILFRVD